MEEPGVKRLFSCAHSPREPSPAPSLSMGAQQSVSEDPHSALPLLLTDGFGVANNTLPGCHGHPTQDPKEMPTCLPHLT